MGCDGGTIPRRVELVKLKKKKEKVDRETELDARWRYCALTSERLRLPIVACYLGRLFNKEALLLALLEKQTLPEAACHIHSLKDVKELRFTPNPSYQEERKADAACADTAPYICPVTGLEMSGRYRFVYLRGCGCVISEKALREAPSDACYKCGKPFVEAEDAIPVNGTEDEVQKLRDKMASHKSVKRKRKIEQLEETPAVKKAKHPPVNDVAKIRQSDMKDIAIQAASGHHGNTSNTSSASCRDVFKSIFNSTQSECSKDKTSNWVT